MAEQRITMAHVRAARMAGKGVLCASGVRAWCASNGVDYRRLIREGLPLAEVDQIEDAFARRVCDIAKRERADHG